MKLLITGKPGTGKTTVIKKVMHELDRREIYFEGFYTEEIREGGRRAGFKIIGTSGVEGILAHVDLKSRYRVGRYGVSLDALEDCIDKIGDSGILIIDEIGRMELFSKKFENFIEKILAGDRTVIASVGEKFAGKFSRNCEIFTVNFENRDTAADVILEKLEAEI